MSALPTPRPAIRYTRYIEELHEFFADSDIYFGISTDIIPLVERLRESGAFRDQMISIVQSILAREGRPMPAAELLEIVANAVGGPMLNKPSPELNDPLSQLYDFLAEVPYPTSGGRIGELVSFPITRLTPKPLEGEIDSRRDPRFVSDRSLDINDSAYADAASDGPRLSIAGPSFRKLLLVAGIGVLVAIILAIVLRPSSPMIRPAVIHAASSSTVAHPPKPSPYGEALKPTQSPVRRHARPKPALDAASQQVAGAYGTQSANSNN